MLVGPGASRPSLVSTTPAIRLTASKTSRPRSASDASSEAPMEAAFSPVTVFRETASAVTVTLSVRLPTRIRITPALRCSPEFSTMPFCR